MSPPWKGADDGQPESQEEERADRAHLHQGELLLAGVVVARGALVLLGVVRAVLVGVLVCGVHELPRVLWWAGRGETHG